MDIEKELLEMKLHPILQEWVKQGGGFIKVLESSMGDQAIIELVSYLNDGVSEVISEVPVDLTGACADLHHYDHGDYFHYHLFFKIQEGHDTHPMKIYSKLVEVFSDSGTECQVKPEGEQYRLTIIAES